MQDAVVRDAPHARPVDPEDARNAYNRLIDRMAFSQQRRVNIALQINSESKKSLGAWIALFGTAKALGVEYTTAHAVLDIMAVALPLYGMLECLFQMGAARGVYQDEVNNMLTAIDQYEDPKGLYWGAANIRYTEIVGGSYWRPATTEIAGMGVFMLWFTAFFVSRYFL